MIIIRGCLWSLLYLKIALLEFVSKIHLIKDLFLHFILQNFLLKADTYQVFGQ